MTTPMTLTTSASLLQTPARIPLKLALVSGIIVALLGLACGSVHAAPTPVVDPWRTSSPDSIVGDFGNTSMIDRTFRRAMQTLKDGDYDGAFELWHEAAERGHIHAQYNLGIAYAHGIGVVVDIRQAIYWWHQAADQGNTDAQYNLGSLYAEGRGVDKDLEVASLWWYRAAIGGDAAAQYNLGLLSALGDGVPQNVQRAVWWWRKSADQGFEHAIRALKIFKQRGLSVAHPQP